MARVLFVGGKADGRIVNVNMFDSSFEEKPRPLPKFISMNEDINKKARELPKGMSLSFMDLGPDSDYELRQVNKSDLAYFEVNLSEKEALELYKKHTGAK